MIALALLSSVALAQLPAEPQPSDNIPGECSEAIAVQEGVRPPESIVANDVVRCTGVVLPPSKLGSLMLWKEDAKTVRKLYAIDTAKLQDEITAANARIAQLEQPVRWIDRPATQRWIGIAGGIVLGAAGTIVATQWPAE